MAKKTNILDRRNDVYRISMPMANHYGTLSLGIVEVDPTVILFDLSDTRRGKVSLHLPLRTGRILLNDFLSESGRKDPVIVSAKFISSTTAINTVNIAISFQYQKESDWYLMLLLGLKTGSRFSIPYCINTEYLIGAALALERMIEAQPRN